MWGQTTDEFDCILKNVPLPEFEIGDWLIWNDMGAYTSALASSSYGFNRPNVYPIIQKSDWYVSTSK